LVVTEEFLSSPDTPTFDPAPAITEPIVARAAHRPRLRHVGSANPDGWALFGRLLLWATRNARKAEPRPNEGDVSA
jgi:hypothetical protein